MIYRELRPMSAGDILDKTLSIYKDKFSTIVPISLFATLISLGMSFVFFIIAFIIMTIMGITYRTSPENYPVFFIIITPLFLIFILAYSYILYLQQGAMVKLVSELFIHHNADWKEAAKFAIKKMNVFFTALTLMGLIVLVAHIPAIAVTTGVLAAGISVNTALPLLVIIWAATLVLATILFLKYMFACQVVMLENKTGMDALQRSAWLFSRRPWPIFGVSAALFVFTTSMSFILAFLSIIPFVGWFIQMAASIFLQPILFIGLTILYYDVRIRAEGFDLLVLAEELAKTAPNQS